MMFFTLFSTMSSSPNHLPRSYAIVSVLFSMPFLYEAADLEIFRDSEDLTSVPTDIDQDVRILHLSRNKIRTVDSSSFTPYRKIKTLYLDGNPLATIGEGTFDSVNSLSKMYFNNCKIETFPSSFGPRTSKIRYWTLKKALPDRTILQGAYFKDFTSLASLYLNNNDLEEVRTIDFPDSISTLHLGATKLTSFPDLTHLPNLATLILSTNSFSDIPQDLIDRLSSKLKSLQLTKCGLTSAPDFTTKHKLTTLYLDSNDLVTIPDLLYLNLTKLRIKKNPITCDIRMCWRRMWAWIKTLPRGFDDVICDEPPNLKGLSLMSLNPKAMYCYQGKSQ